MLIKDKYLKLIFIVSLAAAMLFPLVNIIYIYPSFTSLLVKNTENEAIRLGTHLSNMYFSGVTDLSGDSVTTRLKDDVDMLVHDFNLMKLKAFSSTGEIVYSSSPEDIGKVNKKDYFHTIVALGGVFTKVVKKDTESLEGQIVSRDVVETYVPLMNGDTFAGAFELYYDITERNEEHNSIIVLSSIIPIALMLCFLIAIITILIKSDRSLSDSTVNSHKLKIKSPLHALITISMSILIAEMFVMLFVSYIQPISFAAEALLDSVLLMLLTCPILYYFVVRPFMVNIKEHNRSEIELETFNKKLRQSNQELQDFAHIASHDLQEPLRKVTTFGDRLKSKFSENLGEQGSDYIDRMIHATRRMQSFIDDLLKYSRVTTKAQPFETVDLGKVAEEVVSDLEVRIEQQGGKVELDNLPVIDADPLQMRQLLQNLIGNALKFNKENNPPVVKVKGEFVPVRADRGNADGEYYQLSVEDNGIGFDEQYADRIFGVFQRLHGRSEYEGSGVGLSVCKKIVERHGGSITAKSSMGEGAEFIATLPVTQNGESNE